MPIHSKSASHNLQRETLRKLAASRTATELQKQLATLRIAYSEEQKLLTGSINQLLWLDRIFPTHWPAQTSGRWSTWNPPITNWPRACVNQTCQATLRNTIYGGEHLGYIEHEWTDVCWSIRDILLPDDDEVMVVWDHDNIEGKIHDLIVDDEEAIAAHLKQLDLHTITCCNIFGMDLPQDLRNPHTSSIDEAWRTKYNWQGKDTKQRVLSKNFNHGSKYTKTWRFVYRIKGVEQYGVSYVELGKLAQRYIASKRDAWDRKLAIMDAIRRKRVARSLYGFRRVFYDGSEETGREGFSHVISGTVSDYNNETLIAIHDALGDAVRLLHNAHDGDKIAVKKDSIPSVEELKKIIERPIAVKDRELIMTAGVKIYASKET